MPNVQAPCCLPSWVGEMSNARSNCANTWPWAHHVQLRPPPFEQCQTFQSALHMQARFMDAVVKVYCVHTEPNYSLPWQRKRQIASTSSGFIVASGGDRPYLLTNAHSVEYHSQVNRASCLAACRLCTFNAWLLQNVCRI